MARFLFVWTIMIGAMVGVREAQHFEVDVWPELSRRSEAAVRIVARLGILALALVFVWAGSSSRGLPGTGRRNWPTCRSGSFTLPGRWRASRGSCSRANRSSMKRGSCSEWRDERKRSFRRAGRAGPVRFVRRAADRARAGRFRARARMPADPADRAAAVDDDARAGNLQRLQFLHPAVGAVLPPDGEPDEHRRHHRPAGGAFARDGRALAGIAGADQCRAVGVLRRHLGLLDRGRGEPVEDLHRCTDQGGLRPLVLHRHHRGVGGARGHHPAVDPDDRVGRADLDLDRRDVSRGYRAGTTDRGRADADRASLCGPPRLSDLSERQLGGDALRHLALDCRR